LTRRRSIRHARCNDPVTTPAPGAMVPRSATTVFTQFQRSPAVHDPASGVRTTGEVSALRRRSGVAVTAVLAVTALLLASCSSSKKTSTNTTSPGGTSPAAGTTSSAPAKQSIKVGLAYDVGGRGDKSFNDLAAAGLERTTSRRPTGSRFLLRPGTTRSSPSDSPTRRHWARSRRSTRMSTSRSSMTTASSSPTSKAWCSARTRARTWLVSLPPWPRRPRTSASSAVCKRR